MSQPVTTNTLKSDNMGTVLVAFLWAGLGLAALSLLFSLIELTAPDFYEAFEVLDGLNSIIQLVIILITVVVFLVWMYQLHADLKILFRPYPISSGEALAQLMIPFYNLWGIWNVFATLAERLKSKGGELAEEGSSLKFWLPLLYITGFASRILNRIVLNQSSGDDAEGASPGLILVTVAVDLFLSYVWLEMARLIRAAMRYKFAEAEREPVIVASDPYKDPKS